MLEIERFVDRSSVMKKSLAFALLSAMILSASNGAMAAGSDNKVVAAGKKVGQAIVWPFKKMGEGMKAVGNKIKGK